MAITVTYDIKHGARLFNGNNHEIKLHCSLSELETFLNAIPRRGKIAYIWDIDEKLMHDLLAYDISLPFGRKSPLQVGLFKCSEWEVNKRHDPNDDQHLYTSRNKKVRKKKE